MAKFHDTSFTGNSKFNPIVNFGTKREKWHFLHFKLHSTDEKFICILYFQKNKQIGECLILH